MALSSRRLSTSLRSRRTSCSSVSPSTLRFETASRSAFEAQRCRRFGATPKSSATCAIVRVPRLRIMRTASRLNSSVYFFLGFPIVQTPGAYLLRCVSGKSGQLQPSIWAERGVHRGEMSHDRDEMGNDREGMWLPTARDEAQSDRDELQSG